VTHNYDAIKNNNSSLISSISSITNGKLYFKQILARQLEGVLYLFKRSFDKYGSPGEVTIELHELITTRVDNGLEISFLQLRLS